MIYCLLLSLTILIFRYFFVVIRWVYIFILAQIENFQKKLWLKKKFVVEIKKV